MQRLNQFVDVSFSSTPVFSAIDAPITVFAFNLDGDVDTSTLEGSFPGQIIVFRINQDAVGNHKFPWPTNVKNGVDIAMEAGASTVQAFFFDGADAIPMSAPVV